MRVRRMDWRGAARWWLYSWPAPTTVAVVLVLAIGWWAMPRRIERVSSPNFESGAQHSEESLQTGVAWDTRNLQALSRIWWRALLLTVLVAGFPVATRLVRYGCSNAASVLSRERADALTRVGSTAGQVSGPVPVTPDGLGSPSYVPGTSFQNPSMATSTTRFVAASLCLHCGIVLLLMFMPLAKVVIALVKEVHVGNPAVQLVDDNQHQSHTPGLEAYEKLSDLSALDAQPVPEMQRQVVEPVNVPDRTESPILNLPRHVSRNIPPNRIEFVAVPPKEAAVRRPAELARAEPRPVAATQIDLNASLPTMKEELATESKLNPSAPQVDRQPQAESASLPVPVSPAKIDMAQPVPIPVPVVDRVEDLRKSLANDKAVSPRSSVPHPRLMARVPLPAEIPLLDIAPPPNKPVEAGDTSQSEGTVSLKREAAAIPIPNVNSRPELGGPHKRMDDRLIVGTLATKRVDTLPTFSPQASQLNRPRAQAKPVAMAEDNVGLEAMFTLRRGDTRREFIELFGGNPASEAAVNRGLEWLAKQQKSDGSWDIQKHEGSAHSDTAATGFALLPFLAAGHTPQEGQYQPVVAKGVAWLVATQKPNGDLTAPKDDPHHQMYAHGVAAIALCEVYGMTQLPELRDPAQKSLDFIAASQHAQSGGWRYRPNESGDTSVVGWQVMALKSGEMAGLKTSTQALDGAKRWLTSVESNQPAGGRFGYTDRGANPTMTAEGLLCAQFMGATRNSPRLRAGADFLLKNPPTSGRETSYYWYYGTQVMYHMQGEYWAAWNEKLRDLLVKTQVRDGDQAGTWNPTDQWEKSGGRIYATSIKLLMLEVYYRHLPLYQSLE